MPAVGNAAQTKQAILDAALAEFSRHGLAGARVDRIAKDAGCNKNLIYVYFTNKEQLFASVLQVNLHRIYEELPLDPMNLPDFAGRVFDFAQGHPDLMRLLAWSTLEMPEGALPVRGEARRKKLASLRAARARVGMSATYPPDFLMTMVMSLATAWSAASPFGPALTRSTKKQLASMRECVVDAVGQIAAAEYAPPRR